MAVLNVGNGVCPYGESRRSGDICDRGARLDRRQIRLIDVALVKHDLCDKC